MRVVRTQGCNWPLVLAGVAYHPHAPAAGDLRVCRAPAVQHGQASVAQLDDGLVLRRESLHANLVCVTLLTRSVKPMVIAYSRTSAGK